MIYKEENLGNKIKTVKNKTGNKYVKLWDDVQELCGKSTESSKFLYFNRKKEESKLDLNLISIIKRLEIIDYNSIDPKSLFHIDIGEKCVNIKFGSTLVENNITLSEEFISLLGNSYCNDEKKGTYKEKFKTVLSKKENEINIFIKSNFDIIKDSILSEIKEKTESYYQVVTKNNNSSFEKMNNAIIRTLEDLQKEFNVFLNQASKVLSYDLLLINNAVSNEILEIIKKFREKLLDLKKEEIKQKEILKIKKEYFLKQVSTKAAFLRNLYETETGLPLSDIAKHCAFECNGSESIYKIAYIKKQFSILDWILPNEVAHLVYYALKEPAKKLINEQIENITEIAKFFPEKNRKKLKVALQYNLKECLIDGLGFRMIKDFGTSDLFIEDEKGRRDAALKGFIANMEFFLENTKSMIEDKSEYFMKGIRFLVVIEYLISVSKNIDQLLFQQILECKKTLNEFFDKLNHLIPLQKDQVEKIYSLNNLFLKYAEIIPYNKTFL